MDINILLTPDLHDSFMAGMWLVLGIGFTSFALWVVLRIRNH